ncbi:MAG: ion transporter [Lachnospiraceae bacterium]|nr:ion transporter [Ruminococcus sp.]MCM1276228.1 ion transporter [Lachnospiraceae bacterium]
MYKKIKQRTYEILEVAAPHDTASRVADIVLMILILLNVGIIIADTFKLPQEASRVCGVIETVSVIIFSVEYIVRLWTSDLKYPELPSWRARLRYIRSFAAVIDLVSLLPSFLTFVSANLMVLRMLRIFRLFRAFKLNRYTHALHDIGEVFRRKASQLISSMIVVSFLIVIAAVLMYDAEHAAQPDKFDNALSGIWWAIATLTTVGYGDIYPVTVLGRVMSGVIALLGIGLVAVPTGIITAGFSEQISQRQKAAEREDEKNFCPYCGKKLK